MGFTDLLKLRLVGNGAVPELRPFERQLVQELPSILMSKFLLALAGLALALCLHLPTCSGKSHTPDFRRPRCSLSLNNVHILIEEVN